MKNCMQQILMLALITIITANAFSRELFVSKNGSDSNDGLSENTAFKTISKAATMTMPGDTVTVKSGIYREHVNFLKTGTEGKPITYRSAKNETVVMTWGWDINGWQKIESSRFCYVSEFPYMINMLWERKALNRYMEVSNIDLLEKQPGAFMFDSKTGKLFLHAFDGENPENKGIVAVPYSDGKNPIVKGIDILTAYAWHKGISGTSYNIFDGFELAFFPVGGRLETNTKGSVFRNLTVYGTAGGLIVNGGPAQGHLVENCKSYRNNSSGIGLMGPCTGVTVRNNYLFNNGHCPPLLGQEIGSGGHPYNLAYYGAGASDIRLTGNMIISDDPLRRQGAGPVRCKGGVNGTFEFSGNVIIGGNTVFYPVPDSKSFMGNNTVIGGEIHYAKESNEGKEYKPELKNNICEPISKVLAFPC